MSGCFFVSREETRTCSTHWEPAQKGKHNNNNNNRRVSGRMHIPVKVWMPYQNMERTTRDTTLK